MTKPFTPKCLLFVFSLLLLYPASKAQMLDDYRTTGNVTFDNAQNWQRYTGSAWVVTATAPNSDNQRITIRNGHTATITTSVTLDQVVIENGGIFRLNTHNVTFTLNDGPGDDLEIQSGGTYIHGNPTPAASMAVPAALGNANIRIRSGGILSVDNATGGQADWYANNEPGNTMKDHIDWETDAVFEWNVTLAFNSARITYFPNVTTEVPIFRISANVGDVGANTDTHINGVLEINGLVTWVSRGIKTFRNGIRGTGTITQSANCGAFLLNGTNAELRGSGTMVLHTAGMKIAAPTLRCTSSKTINAAAPSTVSLEGGDSQQIGGSGTLTFGAGITLDVKNHLSLLGPLVATGNIHLSGGSITLNTHNLTLTAGSITGYNSVRYIITNSDKNADGGFLIQHTSGGRLFPVGTSGAVNHYTPAFVTGTVPYQVRVFDWVYEKGNGSGEISEKEQVVKKTWQVLPETGDATARIQLQWNAANEGSDFGDTRTNSPQDLLVMAAPAGGAWENLGSDFDAVGVSGPFTLSTTETVGSAEYLYFTAYSNPFAPLPVTLPAFIEQREGKNVRLKWSTSSETNHAGFEVQRSADLREFVSLGFVAARNTVDIAHSHYYTFTDKNQPRAAYYRLKQLDHNGAFQYSKALFVKAYSSLGVKSLLAYPNPVESEIHLSLPTGGEASFSLMNASGMSLKRFSTHAAEADTRLSQALAHLPPGLYVLQTTQEGQSYYNRLEKR